MPKCPMGVVAVAFALGILAAEYAALPVCLAAAACASLAVVARARVEARAGLLVAVLAFAIGAARYSLAREVPADDVSRHARSVTAIRGTVASDPETRDGRVRLVFKVDSARLGQTWTRATGRAMVTVYDTDGAEMPELEYGSRAIIYARPYRPMDATNPGRFSWRDYLARQGIFACASVYHPEQVRQLARGKGSPIVVLALRAKDGLAASIQRLHPPVEASVIIGMVMGTYAYLPSDTLRDFSRTGTMHLLAASGYNCYVLLFILGPLLKMARVLPKGRSAVVIAAILFYLMMAGAKPSLVRAAVMASLLLLAKPLKRVPNTVSLFFTAGLVILAAEPGSLFDVGFQLSFLAVWALIYVSPIVGAKSVLEWAGLVNIDPAAPRKRRRMLARKLTGALGATAIATTAVTLLTAPVVAYYFNYISLVSLPANMALEIGVPVVFAIGFLSPVAGQVGWLGATVGFVGTWLVRGMLWVVESLGSWQWAAVSVASPGPLAILGYYVVLFAGLSYLRSKEDAA